MSAQLEMINTDHSNIAPNMVYEVKESDPAELILLENGMILACNRAGGELLGCEPDKLKWQHISKLVPQLADMALVIDGKVNPYLKFLSIAGHRHEVVGINGTHFASELFFSIAEDFGRNSLRVVMQPARFEKTTLRHLRRY